jgi:CubicO group peptidase (beta-lactamase class C family)
MAENPPPRLYGALCSYGANSRELQHNRAPGLHTVSRFLIESRCYALIMLHKYVILNVLMLLLLAGCTGAGEGQVAAATPGIPQTQDFAGGIPPPGALLKTTSAVGMERVRTGAEFDAAAPHNAVAPQGDKLMFSPWWDPHLQPPATDLAYCIYSFQLRPEDPAEVVDLNWSPGPGSQICWIGVSDWTRGAWRWLQSATPRFTLPPREDIVGADGRVLIAVVLTGAINYFIPLKLCWVRLGAATTGYDFAGIDALMNANASALGGATLLLMQDGELLYWKSYAGFDLDERVAIASSSKWITAGVLLRVIDEPAAGLSLDDTTDKWLNWGAGDPLKGAITMRQMYSHTSGMDGNALSVGNDSFTWEQMATAARLQPLLYDPGAQFHYGQVSMQVASYICMLAAGEDDYNALLADELTVPLGMARTSFTDNDGLAHTQPLAAGGLFSTARDYALYLQMLLDFGMHDGQHFISPQMIGEMLTDQIPPGVQPPFDYSPYGGVAGMEGTRYGLGNWREVVDPDTQELYVASCQGAFGFSPWIDLRRHVVGVLCVQKSLADVEPLYVDLRTTLAGIIPEG